MDTANVNTTANLDPAKLAALARTQKQAALRQAVGEMVGATFFGEMLKIARSSPLKSELGHGGRGEEVFGAQLDFEFARLAGQGMRGGLTDAICKRLSKGV